MESGEGSGGWVEVGGWEEEEEKVVKQVFDKVSDTH